MNKVLNALYLLNHTLGAEGLRPENVKFVLAPDEFFGLYKRIYTDDSFRFAPLEGSKYRLDDGRYQILGFQFLLNGRLKI